MIKKVFLFLLLACIFTSTAYARKITDYKLLKDSNGTTISAYDLTSGAAVYSETIRIQHNVGYASILVTENKAGGGGDVDISAEYSLDGSNWYTAYTSNMSGTITVEGNIVTTLQNVTRWIVLTPRLAKYMRYKFDPDADSCILVYHLHQVER